MKLKDLVSKLTWTDIKDTYVELYPDECDDDSLEGIENVLKELKSFLEDKIELVNTKYSIVIDFIEKDDWNDEEYWAVSGITDGENTSFSLAYTDWKEWLEMEIEESVFSKLSDSAILSHVLWEMSWCGFNYKEVKERVDNQFKLWDETTKNIANGSAKLISAEEFFKDLKLDEGE